MSVDPVWMTDNPDTIPEHLRIIRASDVAVVPVRWLWHEWLACGKLHVLAGAPGTGKTTLAIALAATLTSGGRWPDGSLASAGKVIVWSGEDDPADTLVPRVVAAGGDSERLYFVDDVSGSDGARAFDPARDVALLEERIKEIGDVALLIVDPVVNAVAGDSHKNTEVRRALAPLVDLASRRGVAVLGISHFSKGTAGREPLERVTGSLAFGALPRVVFVTAKGDADDTGASKRLLARAKSNIGPDGGGFVYSIGHGPMPGRPEIETSWVEWGAAIEGTARELLADCEPADGADGEGSRREAAEFLRDLLADGPKAATAVRRAADQAGHAWATVRRAKSDMGIRPEKRGMSDGWQWSLPSEGAHRNTKMPTSQSGAPSGNLEHLRERTGVVSCRDCMYFDPDESLCLKFDQARQPDTLHDCRSFEIPL